MDNQSSHQHLHRLVHRQMPRKSDHSALRTLTGLVFGSLAVTLLVVGLAAFASDHLSERVTKRWANGTLLPSTPDHAVAQHYDRTLLSERRKRS